MADVAISPDFREGLWDIIEALRRLRKKLAIMRMLFGSHFFLLLYAQVTINL